MAPLRQRFGQWLLKAAVGKNLVLVPPSSRRPFMRPTYRQLALEGYRANGAVFACISALAFSYPEPPLLVWEETDAGLTPLRDHPLSQLLRRPNDQMGLKELLQYTIIYMAIGGVAYWYKVRSGAKRVVQLVPVHAGQLLPIAGETALIDHYEFDNGSGSRLPIPAADIVRFTWLPDALQPQMGQAPLVAAAREVDTDNEATSYLFSLLKNDAMPRLALVMPEDAPALGDGEFKRMKDQWTEEHGGENRGGVALLEGGLDVKLLALNLKELEFNQLRNVPEARICAAFRVPPVVAGLNVGLDQMTYDNVKGMELYFAQRTLVPLWGATQDEVYSDLLPEFGEPGRKTVAFDLDKVVVLSAKNEERRSWALPALTAGAILVNEFRAVHGLPRDANGDVYLRSLVTNEAPAQIEGAKTAPAAPEQKTITPGDEHKRASPADLRRVAKTVAAQRAVREKVAKKMAPALDKWFAQLADDIVARAKSLIPSGMRSAKQDLPDPDDLITGADGEALAKLLKGFYLEVLTNTWPLLDQELGSEVVFSASDPAVARVLGMAGDRVKDINEATVETLRVTLQNGHEQGWSIDHIVRGDPENGVPGLRDIVEETYKDRAETIARTELGTAQNLGAAERYEAAGVEQVLIFDDGAGDEDQPCIDANGQVWTLEEYRAEPLVHPNCTRSAGAYFTEESARRPIYREVKAELAPAQNV